LALVPVLVVFLSVSSSLYAAGYASRITPAEAMQDIE
jgi:ABC-type lipoprotein release transport system permease subunit